MTDPRLTAAEKAVHESLCETVYTCGRVWEAWNVGTMSEDDFAPAWEDDELINDIATEALKAADNASTITTVEELDALPIESVILDCEGYPYRRVRQYPGVHSRWEGYELGEHLDVDTIDFPARVIHWGQA